ncbi:MAG: hypothetical protein SWH68_12175 [Thermodesulfobacteriota bacterium]|nr:hypothetical protein [Thermodesulfobacteriota bacterium]
MKIAVLHYHLRPGGVTTVIRQQIEATADKNEFLVLTGEQPDGVFPAEIQVIPALGYDGHDGDACPDPGRAADAIIDQINQRWETGCDLVHIHNPFLRKNRQLLNVIEHLKKKGMALLLQVHDFAEDGRPKNYFTRAPYPADCHIGVINSRDRMILLDAGAVDEGIHNIANAVTPFANVPANESAAQDERIILYPVRAIRRKNIGEAILLSLFFEKNETLAITLPPNSPADFPAYDGWKAFARDHGLNVMFEASSKRDFLELVAAADAMLTTSITEGFGFSFLEPWTAGKPLCGRRLPAVCADFEDAGLCLDHLYDAIAVPTTWFDRQTLENRFQTAVANSCRAFGMSRANEDLTAPFSAVAKAPIIDFGALDEFLQKQLLSRLMASDEDRQVLVKKNPFLAHLNRDLAKRAIRQNDEVVRRRFSHTALAERLMAAYASASRTKVAQRLDKDRLLKQFLSPENFSLLKWGEYEEGSAHE